MGPEHENCSSVSTLAHNWQWLTLATARHVANQCTMRRWRHDAPASISSETPSLAGTVALKSVLPFRADYLRTHLLSLPQPHELLLLLCFDQTADGVSATSSLLSPYDRHLRMSHFDIVRRPQLRRRRWNRPFGYSWLLCYINVLRRYATWRTAV